MADIVKRLRAINPWGDMDWPETLRAAADEIERLREELDTWKSVFPDIAPDAVLPSRTAEIAAAVAAERDRCAEIAKTGWLSADYNTVGIADADVAVALCEHVAAAIRGGDAR